MKSRQGYKGYVIEARSDELRDGEFSAEFSIEEHDGAGVTETQFYLPILSRRRTLPSKQRFRPGDRRLMWGLRGEVP
jgi:hypothetical protein